MWMVLPTKGCECATCEKLREVVDEAGTLRAPEPFAAKSGDTTGELQQFAGLSAIGEAAQRAGERLRAAK